MAKHVLRGIGKRPELCYNYLIEYRNQGNPYIFGFLCLFWLSGRGIILHHVPVLNCFARHWREDPISDEIIIFRHDMEGFSLNLRRFINYSQMTPPPAKIDVSSQPVRQRDIDLIKSIAVVCIVCVHSRGNGYWTPVGSFDWLSTLFLGCISGMGVPLFFACSGALMLNSEKPLPLRKLYGRSIPRLLLALFFWAAAYACVRLTLAGQWSRDAAVAAVKDLILFRHENHLYFLHIILLVYACLPITRTFVAAASRGTLRYFLALWFLFGCLYPSLLSLWPFTLLRGIPTQWALNMTWAAIGYGVLGYALKRHPLKKTAAVILMLIGMGVTFFGTWYLSARQGALDTTLSVGMAPGICLMSAGLYSLCIGARPGAWAVFLSKASFCVYLVHYFCYLFINFPALWGERLPYLITTPLTTVIVIGLSLPVYWILSHIPWVKRWLI